MNTPTVAGSVGDARQGNSRSSPDDGSTSRARRGSGRNGSAPVPPPRSRTGVRQPSRVRLPELALGLLLVAGGALGAVLWYTSVTSEETVVVAARDLSRGDVVTGADLRGASVSGADGIVLFPGSDAHLLLGQMLTVDVQASSPLTPSMVAMRDALGADEGLFSLALPPGHAPAELAPLDLVRLVVVINDALGEDSPPVLLDDVAEVWSVLPASDFDPATLVTLRGPVVLAAEVAAADHVRLVLVQDVVEDVMEGEGG